MAIEASAPRVGQWQGVKDLLPHLWTRIDWDLRTRVGAALACLVVAKLANVYVPFLFKHMAIQMLQQKDKVVMLFNEDHEVRTVRLNAQHPARVTPSWHGDSVGYYEGDTLVIDTVGIKADRKFAMIDLFGTPYTDKLHVVERWQILDREAVKGDLERGTKENWRPGAPIDANYKDKFLRVQFTIEDEGAFTTPWTASIVYTRDPTEWAEVACAENPSGFYHDKDAGVPEAKTPDF